MENFDRPTPIHSESRKHNLEPPLPTKRKKTRTQVRIERRKELIQHSMSNFNGNADQEVFWSGSNARPFDLYPNLTKAVEHQQSPLKPSTDDIKVAQHIAQTTFRLHDKGNVIVITKSNLIALIRFTEINDLTSEEKEDLEFLSKFAHKSKKYSDPVKSNSWGGKKWKIGWRKSMKPTERITRFTDQHNIQQNRSEHDELIASSQKVSDILGNMLKNMHELTFKQNHNLMMENQVPSFSNLNAQDPLSDLDCTPSLTFTSDGYFDVPHVDQDHSEFTFSVFIPQNKLDGTMANPATGYDLSGGAFVFPTHRVGIDFSQQKGIVKMIWKANKYTHCTFPMDKNEIYTRLAVSLQINSKLFNACHSNLEDIFNLSETEETNLEQSDYLNGLALLLYNSSP